MQIVNTNPKVERVRRYSSYMSTLYLPLYRWTAAVCSRFRSLGIAVYDNDSHIRRRLGRTFYDCRVVGYCGQRTTDYRATQLERKKNKEKVDYEQMDRNLHLDTVLF